jgi:ABC-type sugar transport system ATPase subunit
MTDSVLLRATNITKAYAGVRALKRVSFELCAGEVHGLIGENGAGKSTLIKVITGAVSADDGEIEVGGQTLAGHSPQRVLALALGHDPGDADPMAMDSQ